MKLLVLPFALAFSLAVKAQNDSTPSKYKFGVAVNTSFNSYTLNKRPLSVLLTISKNKHQFEIGPQITLGNMGNLDRKFGIDLNYKYYFKGTDKKFNPFLYVNLNYINMMDKGEFLVNNGLYPYNNLIENYRFNSHLTTLNIGYGMRYNFTGKLYLAANAGFGFSYNYKIYDSKFPDPQFNSTTRKNHFFPTLQGTVSLGFRF